MITRALAAPLSWFTSFVYSSSAARQVSVTSWLAGCGANHGGTENRRGRSRCYAGAARRDDDPSAQSSSARFRPAKVIDVFRRPVRREAAVGKLAKVAVDTPSVTFFCHLAEINYYHPKTRKSAMRYLVLVC